MLLKFKKSAPNERVLRTTQLAKLGFNHPSVVLTADVFPNIYTQVDNKILQYPRHREKSLLLTQIGKEKKKKKKHMQQEDK